MGHRARPRRPGDVTGSARRSGALAPEIDATFDLEDIAAAHRHMETNTQFGKIVVTVRH